MTIFPSSPPDPPPPQAARESGRATASARVAATRNRRDGLLEEGLEEGTAVFLSPERFLVVEDLAEEVLGAVGLRIGEEVFRFGVFDDGAFGHEDDPVRCAAGEAHL